MTNQSMQAEAITSRFRALDCIDNDAVANKRHIIPHIFAARTGREPGGSLGNVMQPPASHWNATYWEEGDFVYENREVLGVQGQQWLCNLYNNTPSERPGNWIWRNLWMAPGPGATGLRWALRSYNTPHCTFEDCDFFAIPKSHALYVSNNDGSVVDRCTFVRIGSQGVQFAHRPNRKTDDSTANLDPNNRPYSRKPLHILRDSHFIDCADGGARTSYNATYFDSGTSRFPGTLIVDGCSFVAAFAEPFGHFKCRSTGGLVVTPIGSQNEPVTTPHMERVEITNTLFDFTAGDRSLANLRSTDEILIEDCAFIGRDEHRWAHVTVDSPFLAMGDSKSRRITIRNTQARGGCELRVYRRESDGGGFVAYSLDQPGNELVIDGETGALISERALTTLDLDAARKQYYLD